MTYFLRSLHRIRRDLKGAAIVEFAIIAPVLLGMLVGIAQLGVFFLARAGLKSAVEDAARYATIYPKPSLTDIQSRITSHKFGLDPSDIVGPNITFTTNTSPKYVTITMGYSYRVNYVLGTKTFTITETRRAYTVS